MTVINKWLLISENCDDLNRCKPCRGKHDEHATYMTTFHWLSRSQKRPLHPKEVLTIKDRLTQPSSWVVSFFLPCDSPVVGERGFSPMVTQLHQLTGSISLACDRYVQYLLTGANPSALNRHRWGLQSWRCRLAIYPLPDLPNQLSLLSPNGPAWSLV
jgi:hypothetical protein